MFYPYKNIVFKMFPKFFWMLMKITFSTSGYLTNLRNLVSVYATLSWDHLNLYWLLWLCLLSWVSGIEKPSPALMILHFMRDRPLLFQFTFSSYHTLEIFVQIQDIWMFLTDVPVLVNSLVTSLETLSVFCLCLFLPEQAASYMKGLQNVYFLLQEMCCIFTYGR